MHTEPRTEPIEKIVIHVNVGPEVTGGAQSLSSYLNTIQAGYHRIVDDKLSISKAADNLVVWGASYMNERGLHLCLVGQASQTAAQWQDAYSKAELAIAAGVVANWCKAYGIPVRHLTPAQVATNGVKGLCGHIDVTNAFKAQALSDGVTLDHWDPGPNFPWSVFLSLVNVHIVPINLQGAEMQLFIDKVHPGTDPNRPRAASVQSDGKILLGNGAKLNAGHPVSAMGLVIVDPGYVAGEKFIGAERNGNGWTQLSILPNGQWATRGYQFIA